MQQNSPAPIGPVNIHIVHVDGTKHGATDAFLVEGLTALTVLTGAGEKTVVPLANVLFYDVEEVD